MHHIEWFIQDIFSNVSYLAPCHLDEGIQTVSSTREHKLPRKCGPSVFFSANSKRTASQCHPSTIQSRTFFVLAFLLAFELLVMAISMKSFERCGRRVPLSSVITAEPVPKINPPPSPALKFIASAFITRFSPSTPDRQRRRVLESGIQSAKDPDMYWAFSITSDNTGLAERASNRG